MRRILLTLFILTLSNSINAQSLSIGETLSYLNQILYSHKNNTSYQTITLKKNGKLVFKHYNSNYILEFDIVNSVLKNLDVNIDSKGKSYIQLSFNNYAIQDIDIKSNSTKNRKWNNIFIKNIDVYTAKKFSNALKYLISLVKSDEKYNVIDDDPFATTNFNPNGFEITSDKNKGEVKLSKERGVYHIDISIGDITENFIFDTGASDVLISKKLEKKLISRGLLLKENYLEYGFYRIADGSIIRQRRLLIPKLKIGNFILSNVQASVTNSNTLLLGKSVLDKFKSWNIDNLTQTLELNK